MVQTFSGMATTNIDNLHGNRVAKRIAAKRNRCPKPFMGCQSAEHHAAGCTPSSPKCRWRRPPPCRCAAYHFPHAPGAKCGNPDRDAPRRVTAPAPGVDGMTKSRWWRARCAIVAHLAPVLAGGVISPDAAAYCRDLLAGDVEPPQGVTGRAAHKIPAGNPGLVKRWYVSRRAIVDLLLPLLVEDGAVVPCDLGERIAALLSGAQRPPVLPNARTLARTKAAPYAWTPPAPELTDAPF